MRGNEGVGRTSREREREDPLPILSVGHSFPTHTKRRGGISLPSLPDLGAAGGGRQRVRGAKEEGKKGRGVKWWRRDPAMWPPLYLLEARAAEKREGEEGAPTRERNR